MKKLLLAALLLASFSCTKEDSKTCWSCKPFGVINGVPAPAPYVECTDNGEIPPPRTDAMGNEYSQSCTRQ